MNEDRFFKFLIAVFGICIVFTICHVAYVMYAYENASIIYFIGKEMW